jgi:uncharacterized protein (TIGR03086 family)
MSPVAPTLEAHEGALRTFAGVLANIKSGQLDDPTPCPEWTVRDVVEHVIVGNHRVSNTPVEVPDELDAIVAAYDSSASDAVAAFAAPDALTRTYDIRIGTVPGTVWLALRTVDVFTHAWDLARATGQNTDLDSALATELLEMSRGMMNPDLRGAGKPFGPERPCPDGASAADCLAAFLGREVSV